MGQYFIRVLLLSGTRTSPMGEAELGVFCQGNSAKPSIDDVDLKGLVKWVNSNPGCKKNQSNEKYRVSEQIDAMTIIFLNDREIQACHNANRIFPRLIKITEEKEVCGL